MMWYHLILNTFFMKLNNKSIIYLFIFSRDIVFGNPIFLKNDQKNIKLGKKKKKNSKPTRCPLFFLKKKIEVKERLKGRDKRRTRKIIVTKLGDNVK